MDLIPGSRSLSDRFYGGQTMEEAKDKTVLRNGVQSKSILQQHPSMSLTI